MQVGELWVKLGLDARAFEQGIKEAQGKSRTFGSTLSNILSAAVSGSKMLLDGITVLAGGFGAAGIAGIKMAGQMEQTKIAFTTMLGSAEKADKFIRGLWDFAAKTPFEFEGLAQSSRQLLAFGFQAKEIVPMMTAIGDAVSALGGGALEIDRVTYALGQMRAKGKVSAEEMMQLAELGIPVWQMLADAIGTSIPEAMDKVSKGAIDATTGINAILTGMGTKFKGSMEAQSQTLLGLWSTVKDNITGILRTLGQEIIDTFDLKDKLAKAITVLQEFTNTLTQFFDLVSQKGLRQAIQEMIPEGMQAKIVLVAGAIAGALVPAIWSLAAGIIAATVPLLPFIAAGMAVAGLAFLIYKSWEPIKEFFSEIWESIKTTAINAANAVLDFLRQWGPLILAAITGPIGLLVYAIVKHWDDIKNFTSQAWDAIKNAVVGAFQWMYGHNYYFQALIDFIRNAWNTIKKFSTTVWNSIKNTLTGIWDAIKGAVTERWQAIQNATTTIWTAISGWLSDLWARIQGQISAAWNAIYGVISGIWNRIKEGFNNLVTIAWNWGQNLMNNFIEGFKSMFSRLWDSLKEAADAVAGFLGFHSPTKLGPGRFADEWGPGLVKTLVEGIKAELPRLETISTDVVAAIRTPIVNVAPAPVIAGGGGSSITVNIYGVQDPEAIWAYLERKLVLGGMR